MLVPSINQNAANILFSEIIYGAEPSVITSVKLNGGFEYQPLGSLIGTPTATPGSSFFLYDSTDETQSLYGITYDTWVDTNNLIAIENPFTFTGNIATTTGSISSITVGNIAGSNGLTPQLASSVITGISNTALLTIGALVTGTGIPAGSTILSILSSTAILISGNVTATTTGVTITTYAVAAPECLIGVATTQGNTTQWIQSALVGVNGTTDIATYLTANPNLARESVRYSGAQAINVVTFNFIG